MITTALPGLLVSKAIDPEWRILAIASSILLLDSLVIGIAPSGPWQDQGFSRGIVGLLGLCLGYVAWYRLTFKRSGLIPWIDQWEDPIGSAKKELVGASIVLFLAWLAGNPMQPYLPDPTGLVISLIGLLMALQAIYVMLSLGPLKED